MHVCNCTELVFWCVHASHSLGWALKHWIYLMRQKVVSSTVVTWSKLLHDKMKLPICNDLHIINVRVLRRFFLSLEYNLNFTQLASIGNYFSHSHEIRYASFRREISCCYCYCCTFSIVTNHKSSVVALPSSCLPYIM